MDNDKSILELILDELKEMRKEQIEQGKTLAEQHVSLQTHMKRSDALEEMIDLVKTDLEPLQKHKAQIDGVLKFFGALAIAIGAVVGVIEIVQAIF